MNIGWYPGHMNKARKDITKALKSVDAVLEIVDARLPSSSENPLLGGLVGDRPRLRVLNKADLADPRVTRLWLDYYETRGDFRALAIDKSQSAKIRDLGAYCYREFRDPVKRQFRLMIVGIPNVGKSTLLNIMGDRKIARVANEPAITRACQEIRLSEKILIADTPGILWPKLEDQDAACRLAATGAIKNTAFEFSDIALWTVACLAGSYPRQLQARYQLEDVSGSPERILEAIGRKRGCLTKNGVDMTRSGEILLNDLRSGKLGRISLERPPSAENVINAMEG